MYFVRVFQTTHAPNVSYIADFVKYENTFIYKDCRKVFEVKGTRMPKKWQLFTCAITVMLTM